MKREKPVLISLIGIDGSGKTTLGNLLVDEMRKEGHDFRYVYGGLKPLLLRPARLLTSRLSPQRYSATTQYNDRQSCKRMLSKRFCSLARSYTLVSWMDYVIQVARTISIPLRLGHSLVADRYPFGPAVDFGINANPFGRPSDGDLNLFFKLMPRPDLVYLLDLDEQVAFSRKTDTPSVEYLAERRPLYKDIVQRYSGQIMDATTPPEEQIRQIRQDVLRVLEAV